MTDTEKAALCARIDELCAEVEYDRQTSRSRLERIDQLKAENERLREEQREYQATIDSLVDECTDHKDENAKLREFLQDLADHIKSDDGFGIDCGWVLDRLRELGVDA